MENDFSRQFLNSAVSAVRLGGDIIIKHLGHLSKEDVQAKQAFDFVTKVDRWSEAVIMQTIREKFPSHSFLTEETLKQEDTGGYRWIIDPLDGTTNYVHSYPMFSISIALEYKSEIVIGIVFDPLKDELFHAVKERGSFLNNRRISVSSVAVLERGLIATGFPFRAKEMIDLYLSPFKEIFLGVSDIRRAGSAAIDLAYVAAGRIDGFFELNLSPWDIAAGALLIKEAGGIISDFGGGEEYLSSGNIVAGNKKIQEDILAKVQQVFKGTVDK